MQDIIYIYRPLLNIPMLRVWAMFYELELVDDPHVTIAYSRTPIEACWLNTDKLIVPAAPGRNFARMGSSGAGAIKFTSPELLDRFKELRSAGASWDYAQYIPHITVTILQKGQRINKITPWSGELIFGPEIMEIKK